jgi:hypothetical protein
MLDSSTDLLTQVQYSGSAGVDAPTPGVGFEGGLVFSTMVYSL